MTSITSPLSAILILLCSAPSFATLMTFTDQSAFQTAVANDDTTTIDFESQAHPFDDFTLAYEDIYDPSSGVVDSTHDTTSGDNYLSVESEYRFLSGGDFTLTFNQTWQAIGFHLIASNGLWPDDAVLSAGAGSVVNALSPAITLGNGDFAYFFGLIDTDGFTSASLATYLDPDTGQGVFAFIIDDIQLVSAAQATNSVPAPSTLALLAMGVLMSLGFKGKPQSTARTTD
jgi:hypothetical protein